MRALAKQSALTAGPKIVDPESYRDRNPGKWDELVAEGAKAGRAERRYAQVFRETGSHREALEAREAVLHG